VLGSLGNAADSAMVADLFGLQVRHAYGDATMWMCVAAVGVVAGVLGAAAARGRDADVAIASPA